MLKEHEKNKKTVYMFVYVWLKKIGSTVLRWVFEAGLLAVSAWADRIKRRGNGLQNRLALVKANFEDLHETWLYENDRNITRKMKQLKIKIEATVRILDFLDKYRNRVICCLQWGFRPESQLLVAIHSQVQL